VDRLVKRLQAGATPSDGDVAEAERLFAREPALLRTLLEAVLLQAAAGHREARRFPRADALLVRAGEVAPASPRPRKALLGLRLESGDWAGAETAGRDASRLAPADAEVVRDLAFALVRQDRSTEAIELLAGFLESRPDPDAQALLDRLRQDRGSEQAFEEARIAHFHLRYDGEAHEDVGREILRVLDRHYATLVRTFDHRPSGPIPVILFAEESYADATGAPSWSAGHYDTFDGRVRVPIGGLTAALTPDLDDTLLHELVHAFVAEMSGGIAPRELHEGIAQLLEGRRTASADAETMTALADGRLGGVRGYYLSALAFVEDLVAQRGQGGLNELLRAMAETGDAERAFRRVYGKGQRALRAEASSRLRQRHGS
jgi:tetratricopeptide (TPR) repeat protein